MYYCVNYGGSILMYVLNFFLSTKQLGSCYSDCTSISVLCSSSQEGEGMI